MDIIVFAKYVPNIDRIPANDASQITASDAF